MKIFTKNDIEHVIDIPYLLNEIEQGLILSSQGKTLIAPVSSLNFATPRGDVHVKSGALLNGEMYVVKIASGFYENPSMGLSSSNGLMLLFSQRTGELIAILLDEGRLTELRTGLVGAIAAKYLAPSHVTQIGIIGAGIQAREQLYHLQHVIDCRDVLVWARDPMKARSFAMDPRLNHFNITVAESIEKIAQHCNMIVTATSSAQPLLYGHNIHHGTHITAIGADDKGKQELDKSVFDVADLIVVDNLQQCLDYGDLSHAKDVHLTSVLELGELRTVPERQANWITVADLTGIAITDLQIAKGIYTLLTTN